MNKDIAKEKLKKIRELAERGIDGEKEQARKLYEKLLEKYEINDEEIADKLEMRWFRFKTELEERLLSQILYKVTGGCECYCHQGPGRRRKEIGVFCTEAEAAEIDLLFGFYRNQLQQEIKTFMLAFYQKNEIFPNRSARLYEDSNKEEITAERKMEIKKAALMSMAMDGKKPPRALIEEFNG